ncbi:MAG: acyltransferase family protein [Lachnospiraceae bacterium]|nr:acyltransferase family protein [Lachnospiraceae bacterium]
MSDEKRLTNFELLRILAMLMVVTLHYFYYSGMRLTLTDSVGQQHIFALAIESFSIVAVNVFVMISGYFMVKSRFKFRRFFRLVFQILFYTLLIPLVLSIFGLPVIAETEGVYGIIQYLLPISTMHYWFITAYLLLYLISPFLNAAFEKIEKVALQKIIVILLVLFCGFKSFIPFSLNLDSYGYDFGWFILLYLTGAYIRIYGFAALSPKGRGLSLYLVSVVLIFTLKIGSYFLYAKTGLFKYFFDVPFHYNFILVYCAAIGLFYAFIGIEIKEGRVSKLIRGIAPLCLGVYLLHMNIDLRDNWYPWTKILFGRLLEMGFIGLVLNMLVTVLVVFSAGILVDFIRSLIFSGVDKSMIEQYETAKAIKEANKKNRDNR